MIKSEAAVDNGPREVQDKTNSISAYNAIFPLADVAKSKSAHPRSVTFLAAIRFFQDYEPNSENSDYVPAPNTWPPVLDSKAIYDYVGVSSSNQQATGAMWDTIFIDRFMKSDADMDLDEIGLIGRSLEKILQVELVPAIFTTLDGTHDREEATIVSNIFIRPSIDLEAVLLVSLVKLLAPMEEETSDVENSWKVRFLVRAYKFLSRFRDTHQETSGQRESKKVGTGIKRSEPIEVVLHLSWSSTELRAMVEVVNAQISRIQNSIKTIIQFLVQALLKPGSKTALMPDSHLLVDSNYYYVTTTIWYVLRNFPTWEWVWKGEMETWKGRGIFGNDYLRKIGLLIRRKQTNYRFSSGSIMGQFSAFAKRK
jgi:hypothetical protein